MSKLEEIAKQRDELLSDLNEIGEIVRGIARKYGLVKPDAPDILIIKLRDIERQMSEALGIFADMDDDL